MKGNVRWGTKAFTIANCPICSGEEVFKFVLAYCRINSLLNSQQFALHTHITDTLGLGCFLTFEH